MWSHVWDYEKHISSQISCLRMLVAVWIPVCEISKLLD